LRLNLKVRCGTRHAQQRHALSLLLLRGCSACAGGDGVMGTPPCRGHTYTSPLLAPKWPSQTNPSLPPPPPPPSRHRCCNCQPCPCHLIPWVTLTSDTVNSRSGMSLESTVPLRTRATHAPQIPARHVAGRSSPWRSVRQEQR
jgi:hypothetical protein